MIVLSLNCLRKRAMSIVEGVGNDCLFLKETLQCSMHISSPNTGAKSSGLHRDNLRRMDIFTIF